MLESVHPDWQPLFVAQRQRLDAIFEQLAGQEIVPQANLVFRAFSRSPLDYRVLILGQDPYPNPQHAVGLAFAVPEGTKPLPPSLKNIYTELQSDLGTSNQPDLVQWQNRGVLLLNRHLTTRTNETAAHFKLGWDEFTRAAVEHLMELRQNKLVSILWGTKAQELTQELSAGKVLASAHPSPLSAYRGFFGSKPFSRANQLLAEMDEQPIDWG
jgi:uracil-DNA glycosylase